MDFSQLTKQYITKNRKFIDKDIPDWEKFFESIPAMERGQVAGDLYSSKDETGIEFLPYMNILPDRLFYKSSIKDIVIPENVQVIGSFCFQDCKDLESCDIQCKITEIPIGCFSGCNNVLEIKIPDTVNRINANAFKDCDKVTILAKKTGRNIMTTQGQIDFLKMHFKEAQ